MSEIDYLCVLLVEDQEEDAQHICEVLSECRDIQFVVDHVETISEALDLLRTETFDVVLLDYALGDTTGFDLLRKLDCNDLFAPPIIMVTNCESRMIDLQAQEVGLDDFLIKRHLNASLLERSIRYALDRKDNAQRLQWLAYYDQLTELPNRTKFNQVLVERIEQASATETTFPLMLLDLDHFKNVNDTHGHLVGDELLQLVAQRLQQTVRDGDFAARLGGDEFVVIGRCGSEWAEVEALAEEIIKSLSETFCLAEHNINTSTSVGIALCPENGTNYSDLLKSADLALYEAKDAGRGTWRLRARTPQLA